MWAWQWLMMHGLFDRISWRDRFLSFFPTNFPFHFFVSSLELNIDRPRLLYYYSRGESGHLGTGHLAATWLQSPVWPGDQIVFLYLSVYRNENLPQCIKIVTKGVQNFAKYQINLNFLPKITNFFVKVAKFSQLWSHCFRLFIIKIGPFPTSVFLKMDHLLPLTFLTVHMASGF